MKIQRVAYLSIRPGQAQRRKYEINVPLRVLIVLLHRYQQVLEECCKHQLPRDEKQVTNFRSREHRASNCPPGVSRDVAADDLFIIMQKAFTEDPTKKFVRAVNAAPEPAVVVCTDRQLQDSVQRPSNSPLFQ